MNRTATKESLKSYPSQAPLCLIRKNGHPVELSSKLEEISERISRGEISGTDFEYAGTTSCSHYLTCASRLRVSLGDGSLVTLGFEQRYSLYPDKFNNEFEVTAHLRARDGKVVPITIESAKLSREIAGIFITQ